MRPHFIWRPFCLVTATLFFCSGCAQALPPVQLGLEEIASGLASPVFLTAAPGDEIRLYIVLRGGRIVVHENGAIRDTPLLNISTNITAGNERGLLGMAFHPNYQQNGYFYVNYTLASGGQLRSYISRFTVANPALPSAVDTATELVILSFDQPFDNHNAGMLAFGPNDGYLYIATGDGGSGNDPANHALNLNSLLGKILRIDVDAPVENGPNYGIPADNPFVASLNALDEIWAYGLRNPYRFSFDRMTGDLWMGDVGQNAWEEVNYQPADSAGGENYGWRVFEAWQCNTSTVQQSECNALEAQAIFPVLAYANPAEGRAIIGGYVYRGARIPQLQGAYFYADFNFARIWSFKGPEVGGFTEWTSVLGTPTTPLGNISSFGEGPDGELYIVQLGGKVYRLVNLAMPEGPGTPHSADANKDYSIGLAELLRIIQFYNLHVFHCDPGSPDGYAPLAGDQDCTPHNADYRPQDWSISLTELLRTVQLYNADCYIACPQGEDGYCALFN